jgi:hypothetical protein
MTVTATIAMAEVLLRQRTMRLVAALNVTSACAVAAWVEPPPIETSHVKLFGLPSGGPAKGRKMSTDLARLMLRAYNAEAENVIRSLRAGSVSIAIKRLEASRDAIARLGKMMKMHISDEYHALRIEEVKLVADYAMKKQEEREQAREEREKLREEKLLRNWPMKSNVLKKSEHI